MRTEDRNIEGSEVAVARVVLFGQCAGESIFLRRQGYTRPIQGVRGLGQGSQHSRTHGPG